MANPPLQLPIPAALPTTKAHWTDFRTRLTNYVAQVGQAFTAQTQRQINVDLTTNTVPFEIAAHSDGTPNAQLIADGRTLHYPTDWTMAVGNGSTTITFTGGAPAKAWMAFLVAR